MAAASAWGIDGPELSGARPIQNESLSSLLATSDLVPVDEWLYEHVLTNERNRNMLRKLEIQLDAFVKNPKLRHLDAASKSSFQRKVVHLVACRYKLEHRITAESTLVFMKTSQSSVPPERLSDIELSRFHPVPDGKSSTANKPSRRNSAHGEVREGDESSSQNGATTAVQVREILTVPTPLRWRERDSPAGNASLVGSIRQVTEEEYAAARARIFQTESDDEEPSVSPLGPKKIEKESAATVNGRSDGGHGRIRTARCPMPGLRGFHPGRGHPLSFEVHDGYLLGYPSRPTLERVQDRVAMGMDNCYAKVDALTESQDSGTLHRNPSWSSDIYDPDFDRSYHRWMPPPPEPSTRLSHHPHGLTVHVPRHPHQGSVDYLYGPLQMGPTFFRNSTQLDGHSQGPSGSGYAPLPPVMNAPGQYRPSPSQPPFRVTELDDMSVGLSHLNLGNYGFLGGYDRSEDIMYSRNDLTDLSAFPPLGPPSLPTQSGTQGHMKQALPKSAWRS
mmetsp:Transcript_7831/g.15768  ORF Transcript_7831/g.15768 Transcript_7831/m.15768 type:complete len:504 (-) Transcript_7831:24-1535(-)